LVPRDSKLMELLLKTAGVDEYEPKCAQQLLEFAHNVDDIKLAIHGRINHSFTFPPRQEFLVQLANERNDVPLPHVPVKYGLRLPPDRHCLTSSTFDNNKTNIYSSANSNLDSSLVDEDYDMPEIKFQENFNLSQQTYEQLNNKIFLLTDQIGPEMLFVSPQLSGGRPKLEVSENAIILLCSEGFSLVDIANIFGTRITTLYRR
ncbi:9392_t:CDS:2, partial [Entrophospora sp. SA101]